MPEEMMPSAKDSRLSHENLIKWEIDGKASAISQYDSIIWKIRSGYVVVLYGALTLLLGTSSLNVATILSNVKQSIPVVLLVAGLSLTAAIIDYGYVSKKLKVVVARNLLVKAVYLGQMEQLDVPVEYLYIAGELSFDNLSADARDRLWKARRANLVRLIFPLYVVAPFLTSLIYIFILFA